MSQVGVRGRLWPANDVVAGLTQVAGAGAANSNTPFVPTCETLQESDVVRNTDASTGRLPQAPKVLGAVGTVRRAEPRSQRPM